MTAEKEAHILLVDDEEHLLISLSDYLAFDNFKVTVARSGEDALKQLEEIEPDIIVLDISMPGMGGLGFLRRISSSEGKPKYPVLVLTARSAMEQFFETIDVDGFIGKPCEEAQLAGKIREILAQRKAVTKRQERSRKKILLGENDSQVADKISEAAQNAGYDIDTVSNGPEVLEKAAADKPDLIVMKEVLPRLNGSAVASLVAAMPSVSTIPMVLYDETLTNQDESTARYGHLKAIKKILTTHEPAELLETIGGLL